MFINIPFRRKDTDYDPEPCAVEKTIELTGEQFRHFKTHLLEDYDFIIENRNEMGYTEDGVRHCILVLSENSNDGILVDAQGSNYARYSAYLPNARTLFTLDRYVDLKAYLNDMQKVADSCAERILSGQEDGRFTLSIPALKKEFHLDSIDDDLLAKMLSSREEFEVLECYDGEITVGVTDDYIIHSDENLAVMSPDEIKIALAKHLLWLNDEPGGQQMDLRHKYIEGFDFSGQEMNSALLSGSRFVNCNFYRTSLCFTEAEGTRFKECSMHDLTAEESNFYGAEFRNCNMDRGMYTHSNFMKAKFVQSSAAGMVLMHSCVDSMTTVDTDLSKANTQNTVSNISEWDGEIPDQEIRLE